jgi:hypothetical protein
MAPLDQFQSTIEMFNYGGTAIHPVSTIDIQKSADFFDGGAVDVPANHAIQAAIAH